MNLYYVTFLSSVVMFSSFIFPLYTMAINLPFSIALNTSCSPFSPFCFHFILPHFSWQNSCLDEGFKIIFQVIVLLLFLVLLPCGQRTGPVQLLSFQMLFRGIIRLQGLLSALLESIQMLTQCPAGGHQMLTHYVPSGNPRRPMESRLRVEEHRWFPCNLSLGHRGWKEQVWGFFFFCFVFNPAVNILNQLTCRSWDLPGFLTLPLSFNIAIWLICKLFHLRKSYILFFYTNFFFFFFFHF